MQRKPIPESTYTGCALVSRRISILTSGRITVGAANSLAVLEVTSLPMNPFRPLKRNVLCRSLGCVSSRVRVRARRSETTGSFPGWPVPRRRWVNVGRNFENNSKNKLRTDYPKTRWKTVEQLQRKSLRGNDGPLISSAHNPKVAGSNPAPATMHLYLHILAAIVRSQFSA